MSTHDRAGGVKPIYWIVWRIARFLLRVVFGVQWLRADRVPETGPVLLTPNHRSYLDPPMVATGLDRELHFFAKAELFKIPGLGWLIRELNAIPVRRGEADRKSLSLAIAAVKAGGGLVLFPEGTRSRRGGFLPPKTGVGMLAGRADALVVPVYISGNESAGSFLRSALRIRRVRVLYGEPVAVDNLTGTATDRSGRYREIAENVMRRVARLRDELEGRGSDPETST